MEQPGYEKRGYLHEDFHLFHLCDAMREPVDWHYHTFHKLCVYLGGRCHPLRHRGQELRTRARET